MLRILWVLWYGLIFGTLPPKKACIAPRERVLVGFRPRTSPLLVAVCKPSENLVVLKFGCRTKLDRSCIQDDRVSPSPHA